MQRVVIVGGGFAGLQVAKKLANAEIQVVVVDRNNHHCFQPLLYQVATAGLSPADIASPIRSILRQARNVEVRMDELKAVDLQKNTAVFQSSELEFNYLILATGAEKNYFGHPEWEAIAPSLKSLADATLIRQKILLAFEKAEMENDPAERKKFLTFVLVGGGPTGVEMAGAIAELSKKSMEEDFRRIRIEEIAIVVVEAGPRLLPSLSENLSTSAYAQLRHLGVEVLLNSKVESISSEGAMVSGNWIGSHTVIWTAGVAATPIGKMFGHNVETDRGGRIRVDSQLRLPQHPNVFIIGDLALVMGENGNPLPGIAPVAIQQGKFVGDYILRSLRHKNVKKNFVYKNRGELATIGRSKAVAQLPWAEFSGFFAWLLWLFVHITFLIGFRNRVIVLFEWAWSYITFQRGARIITQPPKEG